MAILNDFFINLLLAKGWYQDQINHKVLNELDADSIYIHLDWAMKFLPKKNLDSQTNWYSKKGITWHVS